MDKAAADAADAAVGDALCSLGLPGACPLRCADVVVVSAVSDRGCDLEPTLRSLFERAAARVQLADEACATLRRAGKSRGTAIFFGFESVCAACCLRHRWRAFSSAASAASAAGREPAARGRVPRRYCMRAASECTPLGRPR